MAFRHFGGKVPEPLTEWDCPSCGATNTVPLKAGCQTCRAGADARKVGSTPQQDAVRQAQAIPIDPADPAEKAFYAWAIETRLDSQHKSAAKEAFMAGVAWAQAQQDARGVPGPAGVDLRAPATGPVVTSPVIGQVHLRLAPLPFEETNDHCEQGEALDEATAQTILAALAFYRDNQLAYGAVPGQLSAEQVTELITQLSPQEAES